jgi:hypothetical protein
MDKEIFRSNLDKADQTLSEIFDGHHLVGFRDDLEEIWVNNREGDPFNGDSKQIAADVNRAAKMLREDLLTIENGISKFQLLDGITGGITAVIIYKIFSWAGLGWIPSLLISATIFVIITLLNHGILYTKVVIDRLCYLDASQREQDSLLIWKRVWNMKVLRSNTSIAGILVVALCRRVWRTGYEYGLEVVDTYDKNQ